MAEYLLFTLDDRRFALALRQVSRVLRMVEITPLPESPPLVAGVIDYHGRIVPVVDLRSRCGLPPRPPRPSDHLLIAAAGERTVALPVDTAEEIFSLPAEELLVPERRRPGAGPPEGAVTVGDGIVLIYNLEHFFALAALAGDSEAAGANAS